MSRRVVLVIDFNNLVFSSYYGKPLMNSRGYNVNAIRSFCIKVRNLKETFEPTYIVFASDLSREKTFRKKMYPQYKGKRKPHNDDIMFQMDACKQLIALLGFPRIDDETYEADDIMGMISRWDEDNGYDSILVSSDQDLYQLLTEHTFIMKTNGNELIDLDYLYNNYGLNPSQWVDLKIIKGDMSDNIPGVRGVGAKTGIELMNEYGSLQNIYQHIDELRPQLQAVFKEAEPIIDFNRTLMTIVTDYSKINLTEPMLYRTEPCVEEIYQTIDSLEIPTLRNMMQYSLLPQPNDNIRVYQSEEHFDNNIYQEGDIYDGGEDN